MSISLCKLANLSRKAATRFASVTKSLGRPDTVSATSADLAFSANATDVICWSIPSCSNPLAPSLNQTRK